MGYYSLHYSCSSLNPFLPKLSILDEAKIEDLPWILDEGDLEPKNMIFG
jgi:hypothetical protein